MSIIRDTNKTNMIEKGSITRLINQDNYRMYNVEIARALNSLNAAIILGELAQRYEYHLERDELIFSDKAEGEWFYFTSDKCEQRTALSEKEQAKAIKILEDRGIIKKILIGVPAKRHFQINEQKIVELLESSKKDSSFDKRSKLVSTKGKNWFLPKVETIYREENEEENKEEKYKDVQRITTISAHTDPSIVDRDSLFDLESNSFSAEEKELSDNISRLGKIVFLDNTAIKPATVMRWLLKYSFEDTDNALKYYFKFAKLGKNKIKNHEAYVETILKNRFWEIQSEKDYVAENISKHEKRKNEDELYWKKDSLHE